MKNPVVKLSTRHAALVVGVAFICSVVIVTAVDDFLLANFVVPGDASALAKDINANPSRFGIAVLGYLIVLLLDAIIGLALFVVLRPSSQKLALVTCSLRLLYAVTLGLAVTALALRAIDTSAYASIKLLGYVFFALHILVLGYSVLKTNYIPHFFGVLLLLASVTYILFFVDFSLPAALMIVAMFIMALAELSLSIWLIVRRNTLPLTNDQDSGGAVE